MNLSPADAGVVLEPSVSEQFPQPTGLSSKSAIALRRRSLWEAVDSGLLFWRANFFYFLPFYAVPFWVCAFALRLLPHSFENFSGLVLWLLFPFFDRLILHVIATRFFDRNAGFGRLFRGLGGHLFRGLAGDLLWRRFSPLRAAMMPVRALENLPRKKIPQRRQTLRRGGLGFCFFLTAWGIALETALIGGETVFCIIMIVFIQGDSFSITEVINYFSKNNIFVVTIAYVNTMLVETLYMCMGFGLYLNSRVEVEGWDIEIKFREFAARNSANSTVNAPVGTANSFSNISKVVIIALFLGAFFLLPGNSFAAETPADYFVAADVVAVDTALVPAAENTGAGWTGGDVPLETLQSVLDSRDFGGRQDGWGIRLKNPRQKKPANIDLSPFQESLRRFFAIMLRLIIAAFIVFAVFFLLYYLYQFGRGRILARGGKTQRGLPAAPEKSPDSLLTEARHFFEGGDLRRAWGFCAAAAIRSFAVYRNIDFPPAATENDCVNIVCINQTGEAAAFAELVNHWVHFAYGGRVPPEGSFDKAFAFCESLQAVNEGCK